MAETRCWFRLNWQRPERTAKTWPELNALAGRPSDPRDDAHEWIPGLYWVGRQRVPYLRQRLEDDWGAQIIDTDFAGPFGEVVAPGTVEATEHSLVTLLDTIPAERRRKFLRYLESAIHPDGIGQLPPGASYLRHLVQQMRESEL
jgi:hypothetical protein